MNLNKNFPLELFIANLHSNVPYCRFILHHGRKNLNLKTKESFLGVNELKSLHGVFIFEDLEISFSHAYHTKSDDAPLCSSQRTLCQNIHWSGPKILSELVIETQGCLQIQQFTQSPSVPQLKFMSVKVCHEVRNGCSRCRCRYLMILQGKLLGLLGRSAQLTNFLPRPQRLEGPPVYGTSLHFFASHASRAFCRCLMSWNDYL